MRIQCKVCEEIIEVGKEKSQCKCGKIWVDSIGFDKYRIRGEYIIPDEQEGLH